MLIDWKGRRGRRRVHGRRKDRRRSDYRRRIGRRRSYGRDRRRGAERRRANRRPGRRIGTRTPTTVPGAGRWFSDRIFCPRCSLMFVWFWFFFSFPELWAYLKDTVCSNNPLSVDDLVDKLMTAVTAIPQPLLNSVVKDTIKKQKSIDEGKFSKKKFYNTKSYLKNLYNTKLHCSTIFQNAYLIFFSAEFFWRYFRCILYFHRTRF